MASGGGGHCGGGDMVVVVVVVVGEWGGRNLVGLVALEMLGWAE